MSISITPALSLAGAVVGQTFPAIGLSQFATAGSPRGYTPGQEDHIVCYNESHCGVILTLNPSTRSFRISAGAWSDPIALTTTGTQDTSLIVQVEYVLPNPGVAQFGVDYFYPGEPVITSHVLGNSPVNLGGSTLVSNQLVNTTAGAIATDIINIAPAAGPGGLVVNNDGSTIWNIPDGAIGPGSQQFIGAAGGYGLSHAAIRFGIAADQSASLYYGLINSLSSDGGTLVTNGTGLLTTYDGLSLVGLGVAPELLTANPFHTTSTGAANVITPFTPPTGGPSYMISGSLDVANGTSGNLLTLSVSYNDIRGIARTQFFQIYTGTALNGSNSIVNGDYPLQPMFLGGIFSTATVVISYNDPTNTPNDRVTLFIQRFA